MTAVLTEAPLMVVPDSLEAIEAFRGWTLSNGELRSLNVDAKWEPGKRLEAKCNATHGGAYTWNIARGGMTRERANKSGADLNKSNHYAFYGPGYTPPTWVPPTPSITPPAGYGFELEHHTHDAPHEQCSCGIYAVSDQKKIPAGNVQGKVKLWGKMVPGETGLRAQYAYPSEFIVAPELADDQTLKAFGVPITVDENLSATTAIVGGLTQFISTNVLVEKKKPWMNPWLKFAIALNVSGAVLNWTLISLGVSHV